MLVTLSLIFPAFLLRPGHIYVAGSLLLYNSYISLNLAVA
jgi:hypothetical protein